jgi:hypothetical protein
VTPAAMGTSEARARRPNGDTIDAGAGQGHHGRLPGLAISETRFRGAPGARSRWI